MELYPAAQLMTAGVVLAIIATRGTIKLLTEKLLTEKEIVHHDVILGRRHLVFADTV